MRILAGVFILVAMFSCQKTLTEEEEERYTKRGKEIALQSFNRLSSELQTQMQHGGVESAIEFCNVEALPLTAELSKEFNAIIKNEVLEVACTETEKVIIEFLK